MANDGLLPKTFFAAVHPKFRTPWKNTILVGLLAAVVGSTTPIDDIGKMVNIGTLLAFVIVSAFRDGVALYESQPAAAFPDAVGAVDSDPWRDLEWVHDVQAGLGQLGAAGHLADHRAGGVLLYSGEAIAGCSRCNRVPGRRAAGQ